MKFKVVIVLLLLISTRNLAQLGNNWMLGENGRVDFSNGNWQYFNYLDTFHIRQTTAGISDSFGQLLFWTNGSEVFKSNRIPFGTVGHLSLSQSFVQNGLGLNIPLGAIVVPDPGNINIYYLFYSSMVYNSAGGFPYNIDTHLFYSKVDMSANGGNGAITNNTVFVEDSLYLGYLKAVRHGNGRDWWIISHKIQSNEYLMWQVTPTGVSSTFRQSAGTNIISTEFIGSIATAETGDKISTAIGENITGQLYKRLDVLDFDRCSGVLSNFNSASWLDTGIYMPRSQFSPNGRFVYVTSSWMLYQFDLWAPNLLNSQTLIDVYDGTYAPFEADFQLMEQAPDGKIYCHSRNGNYSLHVINNPDSIGLGCDFVQNQFYPPSSLNISGLPNMPNYELGPLIGSPCDTLVGINENEFTSLNLNITPNPSIGSFVIKYLLPTNQSGMLNIYNILGEEIYSMQLLRWSSVQHIELPENITNGLYICKVRTKECSDFVKLIVEK